MVEGIATSQWAFAVWREDGTIVFDDGQRGSVFEVSAEGGAPSRVSIPGTSDGRDASFASFPVVDRVTGDLLFFSRGADPLVNQKIERLDSMTGERHTILDDASLVDLTATSHLLFMRDEVLMAATYDNATHRVGAALPLAESIGRDPLRLQLALSPTGALAYIPIAEKRGEQTLVSVTRTEEVTRLGALPTGGPVARAHVHGRVDLSPDGLTALISGGPGGDNQAFMFDLTRRVSTRLNLGAKNFYAARWHPDGRRIALGGDTLRLHDLDKREDTVLLEGLRGARFPTWTSDGTTVA